MKMGKALAKAKDKTVVRNATLRGLGTTIIGAGVVMLNQPTIEEKVVGIGIILTSVIVYVIKDVINK